jgi:aspartyl-tRNA synthetase
MSFVEQSDVFDVVENFLVDATAELSDQEVLTKTAGNDVIREGGKFFTLTHHEAIEKYGSDKPDLRYGLEMVDVADIFTRSSNEIFSGIAADSKNNRIKALKVPGGDNVFSKTQMKGFESYVRKFGAGGLGYFQMKEDGLKGPLNKFFEESDLQEIVDRTELVEGDVIFFGAGERDLVCNYMGRFRVYLAELLELQDPTKISFCWITDFPIFEKDEVTGKIDFEHNPFSMPQGGPADFDKTGDDLLEVIGYQYDLSCNGYEILSGAIRNHDIESLVKAFETVGRSADEVKEKFGAVYEAFQY